MSKIVPAKADNKNIQKLAQPVAEQCPLSIRHVSPISAPVENQQNLITVYKDLNQIENKNQTYQQQHLIIAFGAFLLLGIGLFMGSFMNRPRTVASDFKEFPVEGTLTQSEHYQYDKACYKGENGEQVCMTRTSRK